MDPIPINHSNPIPLPAKEGILQEKNPTLKETAQQFESLFLLEFLREMEKTLEQRSIFGGGIEGNMYGDIARWELAKNISSQAKLGIADALLEQLTSRSEPLSKPEEETP